jgi:hypothetical protein
MTASERKRILSSGAWRLLAAVLLPFPIATFLIYLDHEKSDAVMNGYVCLAICAIPGIILIATPPFRAHVRIVLGIIYIPIVAAALFAFGIVFVGVVFHQYF